MLVFDMVALIKFDSYCLWIGSTAIKYLYSWYDFNPGLPLSRGCIGLAPLSISPGPGARGNV